MGNEMETECITLDSIQDKKFSLILSNQTIYHDRLKLYHIYRKTGHMGMIIVQNGEIPNTHTNRNIYNKSPKYKIGVNKVMITFGTSNISNDDLNIILNIFDTYSSIYEVIFRTRRYGIISYTKSSKIKHSKSHKIYRDPNMVSVAFKCNIKIWNNEIFGMGG